MKPRSAAEPGFFTQPWDANVGIKMTGSGFASSWPRHV